MLEHGVVRGADEAGLVARIGDLEIRRQRGADLIDSLLDGGDHVERVGARLLAHGERDRRLAVEPRNGTRLLVGVLHFADIGDADGRSIDGGDDDAREIERLLDAAERTERELAVALVDAPAGDLDVLRRQRQPDLLDVVVVGGEFLRIQQHLDLALALADEADLADAVDRLDVLLDLVIDYLGHLAQVPLRTDDDVEHGRGVGGELLHHGRARVARQLAEHRADLVADLLRGDLGVFFENESDGDDGDAFGGGRVQFVDAGDGVDRLFERLGHLRLDFLGRGARQHGGDGDEGELDLGEEVDAELPVGIQPDHHQRQDEHGGEDGPANADFSQLLHRE